MARRRRGPFPTEVWLLPVFVQVPRTRKKGTVVTRIIVITSNFSKFTGKLTLKGSTHAMAMLTISGHNVVLGRNLVPADVGTVSFTVTATENGVSVSATGTLVVVAVATVPVPTAVTLDPASMNLNANAVAGTVVTSATVTMSDGSSFSGVLVVEGPA